MQPADLLPGAYELEGRRSGRPETYLFFAAVFTAILFLSHAALLELPYYWDEAGHFVPSALDLYLHGLWIPVTTTPNVHPPLVKALIAAVWGVTGVSIESARSVMLALASVGLLGSFLLAIELCRRTAGSPAFLAILFLLASPLFFMQSMMVQLDMPAMVFTSWALFLFLRGRLLLCGVACTLLVLAKETGALVPSLFFLWLWMEGRRKVAILFLLPLIPLAAWLIYLRAQTGLWLGDSEFTGYNLFYPLHPARFVSSLVSRTYSLFFANFHWIGTLAIAAGWRAGLFRTGAWRLAAIFAALHTLSVSILGGAILDRYLLPVLPVFYAAAAAGISALGGRLQTLAATGFVAGLFVSLFWNPPFWPFPQENNLAMVHFVDVHRRAAQFIETSYGGQSIGTAWPMSIELRRPELGYVARGLSRITELRDFDPAPALAMSPPPQVFVLFSRGWDPPHNLLRDSWLGEFARTYLMYHDPVEGSAIEKQYGLRRVIRFERHGQWVEIYAREPIATAGTRWNSRPSTEAN